MASTGSYVQSGAAAARAPGNTVVAAVILGLFVLAAIVSAARKDITQGFDEVAHVSYVAQIQHDGEAAPALPTMRLLDPRTFQFTGAANYLNHPPMFYALLARLGPRLEGDPGALFAYRLIDIAIAAIGFAALLGIGLAARWPRLEFYAYAVPLGCTPILVPLAAAVNNDNLAFCGGAVALLGVWQLLATGRESFLALALGGVVVAGFAKLTGLLLSAGLVGGVVAYMVWRRQLPWTRTFSCIIAVALVFALAATPYITFILRYGSPTPETPAQIALLTDGARAAGWADLPRQSFPHYLVYFAGAFVADWMPTLGARSDLNYAALVIPVEALGCALAGLAVSLHRLWRRQESELDVVVMAGALAIGATFAIHVTYSYGRYAATGWLMDAYPRYYLPLIAIVPLACLSLLAGLQTPRWRNALLALLISGPVLFRVFGAPLG
ncbi:MAG: hypothetical protein WBG15_18840 [Xanthobacteraceae bacterium]